ncbi:Cell division protein ZapD [Legionella quinlivanii]|uniref:Cell division protein ZapD n=1 Tax=Legionella quinlivanii TaxID=45073 RepID=A0A0W0Y4E0_9GAMM|nr:MULTISPECIES: cell division protein ZapD [Legionella]KTD51551.1 Cell division protein ZapD [Legionella quinlivanii]MCE3045030.1 cell division protein ZapD [Legionella sp. 16cNR16C]MCW8450889.1 cell division protein ZapD [Legionella quinlivanii]RAP36252.1 cell division protein ZapD [Legionella quinlivanii]SEF58732.1 cell division protein ZapD [Legionella quinlivanii DSM 21216]
MQQETITFQLATHSLPKIALRLECLHQIIKEACAEYHPVIHHYALQKLIETVQLIQKPELKSRFLKELMRIEHSVNRSNALSPELYARLFTQIQILSNTIGRFGDDIHQDPFLNAIRTAQSSQHLDCEAHPPQLILWMESYPEFRQSQLSQWLGSLRLLHDTVSIYLSLLRNSADYFQISLNNGFYQQQLPPRSSCHLILLRMEKASGMVPKMQLGHHGLSLSLCEMSTMREIRDSNAKLDIAICQL